MLRNIKDGYQPDLSIGRTEVDGDGVFYLDASVDGQGGTIRDKPVFTIDEAAFYLNRGDGLITEGGVTYQSGAAWAGAMGTANNNYYTLSASKTNGGIGPLTTLSFGFYETQATLPAPYIFTDASDGTNAQYIGFNVARGFSALTADQRVATRDAIAAWDEVTSLNFVETHFSQGDINFMNTTTGPQQASAYLPYDYGTTGIIQDNGTEVTYAEISGDVFINNRAASNFLFDEGQYGLTTLIHEIGHSLGLEHPGNYNFSANFSATYVNGAEYYQDSRQYSIMSYWDAEETGGQHVDWTNLTYRYGSTPGIHDIAAVQRIYGVDTTTRTGDTVYGFNSNAGKDAFNFVLTPTPVVTIWDAGGNDTLDLSGYNTPSLINLNQGAFSSAGGTVDFLTLAQINANRAAEGLAPRTQATFDLYNNLFKIPGNLTNGLMQDNIGIAYGAVIENATGGGGNDVIIGNEVANRLIGNAGNDSISGGAGNDILNGGVGNDNLKGGNGLDVVTLGAGNDIFVAEVGTAKVVLKTGLMSVDIITDFDASGDDFIDLSGLAVAFNFKGTSANKNTGDLTYKTYSSVNGAENALGFDIDGNPGAGGIGGPVTVVYGNTNGGAADFAIVLLNTSRVDAGDFLFNQAQAQQFGGAAGDMFL